jgi:fibronectin-binding autotransporter adhesin
MYRCIHKAVRLGVVSLLLLVWWASTVQAAAPTWTGAGTSSNWSLPANWSGTVGSEAVLTFTGTTRTTNNNDTAAGTYYGGIVFDSAADSFTLNGNQVVMHLVGTNGILNQSANPQTVNLNVGIWWMISGDRQMLVGQDGTGTGTLTMAGVISNISTGVDFGITKVGSGTVVLAGSNTFTGTATISAGSLTLANTLALQNATLDTTGTGLSFGTLTAATMGTVVGANPLVLQNGTGAGVALTIGGRNNDLTIATPLQGAGGSLVKIGTGRLLLSGTNSYNNGTTISGGLLQFGTAASLPTSGSITINGGGALVAAGPYSTVIDWLNSTKVASSSTGAIAIVGSDSEVINLGTSSYSGLYLCGTVGGSTYSGTLTATGSMYRLGGGSSGGGGLTVSSALGDVNGVTGLTVGPAGISSGAIVVLTNTNNSYSGGTTVNGGLLQAQNTGALPGWSTGGITVNGGASLAVNVGGTGEWTAPNIDTLRGAATFNGTAALGIDTSDAGGSFTYSSSIGGGLGLRKLGTGTLLLTSTNNTYSGGTTVSAGILQASNTAALPSWSTSGGIFVKDGAILAVNFGGATDWTASNVNTLRGSATFTGTAALGIDTSNASGTANYSSMLSGTMGLAKLGTGTLKLSGNNGLTYRGFFNVLGGTLQVGNANALGRSQTPLPVTVNDGTLDLNGYNPTIASLNGSAAGTVALGANTLTVSGDANSAFAGVITGTGGGLTITNGNAIALSGSNTFTGKTIVGSGWSVGVLTVANPQALQFSTVSCGYDSGSGPGYSFVLFGTANTAVFGGLEGYGFTGLSDLRLETNTALDDVNYVILPTADSRPLALSVGNNNANTTFSGSIVGSGSLTKLGTGTLVLNPVVFDGTIGAGTANTYSGGTTVAGGTLQLAQPGAMGASGAPLIVNAGTLDLYGFSQSVGALSGGSGAITSSNGAATLTTDFAGSATYNGSIGNTITLVKQGSGILVLTNTNNAYGGGTVLGSGEISVSTEGNLGAGGVDSLKFNGGLLRVTGVAMTSLGTHGANWNSFNGGFDIADAANTFTVTAVISGSSSLIKTGSGKLALAIGAAYTGGTTVEAGVLKFGDGSSPSIGPLNTNVGSTLEMGASMLTIGNGDGNSDIAGTITGSGGSLAVNSTGVTVISGSNSFTSPTALGAAGTLTLANSQALSMSTLDYGSSGGSLGFGTLTAVTLGGMAGTNYHAAIDNRLTLTNASGTAVTLTVGNNGESTYFGGDILGNGGLKKIGAGTLTLAGSDDYSGGTTVLGGVLDIASVSALPGNSTLAIANTAEVVFATDLGSAIQLSLMLPGAGGAEPGMTCFHVTTSPASVPEPGTLALLAAAVLAGIAARRRSDLRNA